MTTGNETIAGQVDGTTAVEREDPAVPQDRQERDRLLSIVNGYASERNLVPPLSMEELQTHADAVIEIAGADKQRRNFIAVLISNAVWRDTMAAIPYERRVLLLPQCLRTKNKCPARLDEFGLLCEQCGGCPTGSLQAEAEELGYVVLVAEGTTVVTRLLESGKVDAVIGVSCLPVLERAFPHMAADAIPGIAIPLNRTGCEQTAVDVDRVRDAIHLKSGDRWSRRIDIDRTKLEVESWFQRGNLRSILGVEQTPTEEIAMSWLAKSGKRWRPFLSVCVFEAMNDSLQGVPDFVRRVAIAVECFHKASLVHDDIEDNDDYRYGEITLHRKYGIPIALNVGDFLLGEGYRLIATSGASDEQKGKMLAVAAEGHRTLCLGQGDELAWTRNPSVLSTNEVLEIFRRKTAPAFEVALRLGAVCGGAGEEVCRVLKNFSEALGIAYQIQDDIEDFHSSGVNSDLGAMRPSLILAIAYDHAQGAVRERLADVWKSGLRMQDEENIAADVTSLHVEEKARQLLEHHKNEAVRSLNPLENARLKGLLRRIASRIIRAP